MSVFADKPSRTFWEQTDPIVSLDSTLFVVKTYKTKVICRSDGHI